MSQYKTLMPIRTKGSQPPLFCVHGEPLRVAQRIRADRPIYGLSHIYHADFLDKAPDTIEELASQYLSEVRQVQPRGPYYFLGFSAGGLIAYEMASQILAQGDSIGGLTLAEPTVMGEYGSKLQWVGSEFGRAPDALDFIVKMLKRVPKSLHARSHYYFDMAKARVYFWLKKPLPEDLRWLGYLKSLGPAMSKYRYEPLNCQATFLYRKLDQDETRWCREFWSALVPQGVVEIYETVKEHNDFMLDPALAQMVALVELTDGQVKGNAG
jgi:pimeloyl-ACP methyl ester carboxylesterase